ncbi:MAG: DUF3786 domain-containing protein [Dethiobacter sp.]|jgi:hypothetical protein|nr:DUF3786 domain-containing protein [Dethiobacter sp.]MBS3899641.1 DUF3786 domain-containing protein [Dethiobacter sp.]MBS3983047.1 DUF3786 domain-containing protein [Dethiobacter sp.]MCL4463793.1 DUF3786 domain-containing protein [Bacillota bacterium]MCL5994370.1 DUF3786 domain-containing protein [Bacillota bacterium]
MNKNPYNLDETISVARSAFAQKPALEMAANSGCLYDLHKQRFTVPFLGQKYAVSYPDGLVSVNCGQAEAPLITAILLLHYLSHSTGAALSRNWISYKDLPGGSLYLEPFKNRAVIPFVKKFGGRPADFALAAEKLGGEQAKHGDIAYIIPALPRVPLLYILWQGDEEFPPNATILFDDCANSYLHTEDYAILAGMTVGAMLTALKG